jgi:hypothetical protein
MRPQKDLPKRFQKYGGLPLIPQRLCLKVGCKGQFGSPGTFNGFDGQPLAPGAGKPNRAAGYQHMLKIAKKITAERKRAREKDDEDEDEDQKPAKKQKKVGGKGKGKGKGKARADDDNINFIVHDGNNFD